MNLQEEILKIRNEMLDEFDKRVEALKAEEQEFPQEGDSFYSISETGNIEGGMIWGGYPVDMNRMAIGNVFRTKDQAEFAAEKLRVEAELRKFSRKFIWGGENWILSMGTNKDIFLVYEDDEMNQGAVYFEDEYKALEAIEAVGKERIKKYIFGVED